MKRDNNSGGPFTEDSLRESQRKKRDVRLNDDPFTNESMRSSRRPVRGYYGNMPSDNSFNPPVRRKKSRASSLLLLAAVCVAAFLIFGGRNDAAPPPDHPVKPTPNQTLYTEPAVYPEPVVPQAETEPPSRYASPPLVEPFRKFCYFRSRLSPESQQAYDSITEMVACHADASESLVVQDPDALKEIVTAVRDDHPELFWFTGGFTYQYYDQGNMLEVVVTPAYYWDKAQTEANVRTVQAETASFLQYARNLTPYEKVKAAYEWIIDRTAYDYAYRGKTMFELLYEGRAVCEGYAKTFQYLMNCLDVESLYITGVSKNELGVDDHAWNMVKLDNQYYHVDVTWGDPLNPDGSQDKNFNYLCITDAEIGVSHTFDRNVYPSAFATDYDYYRMGNRFLYGYDENLLAQWVQEDYQGGAGTLTFKCSSRELYNDICSKMDNGVFQRVFELALGSGVAYRYTRFDMEQVISISWP